MIGETMVTVGCAAFLVLMLAWLVNLMRPAKPARDPARESLTRTVIAATQAMVREDLDPADARIPAMEEAGMIAPDPKRDVIIQAQEQTIRDLRREVQNYQALARRRARDHYSRVAVTVNPVGGYTHDEERHVEEAIESFRAKLEDAAKGLGLALGDRWTVEVRDA